MKALKVLLSLLLSLLLVAIIIVAILQSQKNGRAKARFEDGSYFEVTAPPKWCSIEETLLGLYQKTIFGGQNVAIIARGKCGIFSIPANVNNGIVNFIALEKTAYEAGLCKNRRQILTPFESVGGKVFYCLMENKKMPSRAIINFIFPVDKNKSLSVSTETTFFANNVDAVNATLKSLNYYEPVIDN